MNLAQCFFFSLLFSASTGSAEEIDWREEMFQKVSFLIFCFLRLTQSCCEMYTFLFL
jgi:hypothetical protein